MSLGAGLLVSIEGISGVGKTYIASQMLKDDPDLAEGTVLLDEFSQRPDHGDLGHDLLHALADAATGDPLLRSGRPATETLMLLAIKAYDYESRCLPALRQGLTVIEGRSLHCTAVYQSLIMYPNDDNHAFSEMLAILKTAALWRPLPDLTVLIADDPVRAIARAEDRDGIIFSPSHRKLLHRAAALFEQAATNMPGHVVVIDRREFRTADAVSLLRTLIMDCRRARTLSYPPDQLRRRR